MASERRLPATQIVRVIKVVVPMRVSAERGVVDVRCEDQRSTAAPTSNQFRREQLAFSFGAPMRVEEPIKRTDTRLIFAKAYIGSVATEYVRLRHRQRKA